MNPLSSRPMQQSMVSSAWLMPYPKYWPRDAVLVTTEQRNYTINEYQQFFRDLHYENGYSNSL